MIYLLIPIVLLLVILFIPIYINIVLKRKNDNDNIKFTFYTLKGLIKYDIEIPLLDLVNDDNKLSIEIQDRVEKGNQEKDISKNKSILSITQIIKNLRNALKYHEVIKDICEYLIRKTNFRRFKWSTKIGLENAAVTAVLTGSLWSIKYMICNYIITIYQKEVADFKIDVVPLFDINYFETHLDCIIKLKLAHIIIAGYKGLKVKIKGGVGNG